MAKKLKLNKKTIARLNSDEMVSVKGGTRPTNYISGCNVRTCNCHTDDADQRTCIC